MGAPTRFDHIYPHNSLHIYPSPSLSTQLCIIWREIVCIGSGSSLQDQLLLPKIFLGVWSSTLHGQLSGSCRLRENRPLSSQKLTIANRSSAWDGIVCPSFFSMLISGLAWRGCFSITMFLLCAQMGPPWGNIVCGLLTIPLWLNIDWRGHRAMWSKMPEVSWGVKPTEQTSWNHWASTGNQVKDTSRSHHPWPDLTGKWQMPWLSSPPQRVTLCGTAHRMGSARGNHLASFLSC